MRGHVAVKPTNQDWLVSFNDSEESTVGNGWWLPVLAVVAGLAGVLLFTPYEAALEGVIAVVLVTAVLAGFLIHPRKNVFYVRTALPVMDTERNRFLEHDLLAVKVELVRLWLLFVPTALAVASLVFLAAGGPTQFSFLNWLFSSPYAPFAILVCQYPPILVLLLTAAWIDERRVLRDAEACAVRSFSISRAPAGHTGRVSYLFMGEHGEYYGGDCFCLYIGVQRPELATIVFYNVRKPERNKIAMGFLFHRLTILGRGVTDLDKQTEAAQTSLAETSPLSSS
jgi:hypothetical protein